MDESSTVNTVVDLRGRRSWTPAGLLAPPLTELWMRRLPLTTVGELAEPVRAKFDTAADSVSVVTPSSVDPDSGAITATERRGSGPVMVFGANGLRSGDLLVPPASGPVILLSQSYAGFVFSGSYLALRATRDDPLWLWAVLNTRSGHVLRRSAASHSHVNRLTPAALSGLPVPLPPPDWAKRAKAVGTVHERITVTAASREVGQSWWRTVTLPRDGSWSPYLATRQPELLDDGIPLGTLAVAVRSGVRVERIIDHPRNGWLPYLTSRDVRTGSEPSAWTDDTRLVGVPGDVAVAEVGARGPALALSDTVVPGPGLLLARFVDVDRAEAVSAYLNSVPGQAVRRLLVTGAHIPHLGLGGLRRFPIPSEALRSEILEALADAPPALPGRTALELPLEALSERLERLLWS